jgi:hypothetical protein
VGLAVPGETLVLEVSGVLAGVAQQLGRLVRQALPRQVELAVAVEMVLVPMVVVARVALVELVGLLVVTVVQVVLAETEPALVVVVTVVEVVLAVLVATEV